MQDPSQRPGPVKKVRRWLLFCFIALTCDVFFCVQVYSEILPNANAITGHFPPHSGTKESPALLSSRGVSVSLHREIRSRLFEAMSK